VQVLGCTLSDRSRWLGGHQAPRPLRCGAEPQSRVHNIESVQGPCYALRPKQEGPGNKLHRYLVKGWDAQAGNAVEAVVTAASAQQAREQAESKGLTTVMARLLRDAASPPDNLWDRLALVQSCCDVDVTSARHRREGDVTELVWAVSVKPRDGSAEPVRVEAETMLDALAEAMTAAATVCPRLRGDGGERE
jgi:hypothetical protein